MTFALGICKGGATQKHTMARHVFNQLASMEALSFEISFVLHVHDDVAVLLGVRFSQASNIIPKLVRKPLFAVTQTR